jgi:bis(5'-nucleosidyl)-tetraphosphatase
MKLIIKKRKMKQFKNKYRKAVFIVTYKIEKNIIIYLILKRKLHWTGWEFPKGGIEKNEHIKKTVNRELLEETGQKSNNIKSYRVSGKYNYHKILSDRPGFRGQSYKLFSAQIKNKKIVFDKREHYSYGWYDYNQALKKLTWINQRKCLSIVDNYLNKQNKK